jgi:hypothetical protein
VRLEDLRRRRPNAELSAEFHAVQAVVSAGKLIALRSGKADLSAELWCEGVPMRTARRTIDLEMDLGTGLLLAERTT